MALQTLFPGSGEMVPPQPEHEHLRFTFKMWGAATAPDVPLSDIRAFLGVWDPMTGDFRVWDSNANDWATVLTRQSYGRLPARRDAPADIDRGEPVPAWFEQGAPIEQAGAPTLETVGLHFIPATPFQVAIPESSFPRHPFPLTIDGNTPNDVDVLLIQLAGRSSGRKKWFRGANRNGFVARVNFLDRDQPQVSMTSPVQWNAGAIAFGVANTPITFSGRVIDPTTPRTSGISGAFLTIYDRGSIPERVWDFPLSQWRDLEPGPVLEGPPHRALELEPVVGEPGAASFSTVWQEPAGGSGFFEANIHVVDKRGNERTQRWWFLTDEEAPTLQIHVPAPNQSVIGPQAIVEAEASDGTILRQVTLQIVDNFKGQYWHPRRLNWVNTPTAFEPPTREEHGRTVLRYRFNPLKKSGYFSVRLRAVDQAGNVSTAMRTMHYLAEDTVAPIVQIQSPLNGSIHPSGSVELSGRVLDNHQVAVFHLYIDPLHVTNSPHFVQSIPLTPVANGWQTWSHTLDMARLDGPGSYKVTAIAIDPDDNESQTDMVVHLGTP